MDALTSLLVSGLALSLFAGDVAAAASEPVPLIVESIGDQDCDAAPSAKTKRNARGVLTVLDIALAGDQKLDLGAIEIPSGWISLSRRGKKVLRQVTPCAPPLVVPIAGDWVSLRLSALAQGARVRFGASSEWIEPPAGDSGIVTAELGAKAPTHGWRAPRWVPYHRSLSRVPVLLEHPSGRPQRISFDEQRALNPSPILPARRVSLPAAIEFPDVFLPRDAKLRLGLDVERESELIVEVETISEGARRTSGTRSVRPESPEPAWIEIPLGTASASHGDLRLRISSAGGSGWARIVDPKLRGEKPVGPPRADKPNVILITLDTVRADHLSIYGYARPTTPFLESIADELLIFENAYSQVPSTRPSHYSIFSSRYPHDLGIWSNEGPGLPRSELTLAEVMRSAGWRTGAVLSVDFLMLASGLDQGFDEIHRPEQKGERLGALTTEVASDFIERNADAPFFLWIHYFDAHLPYQPLPEYRDLFWQGAPPTDADIALDLIEKEGFGTVNALPHRGYMTAMYDSSLRYLDDQIRSLYALLEGLGLLDDTAIVIAADHGESLGENGVYFAHDGLYEPTVRVPLMLRLPDARRTGRVEAIVENLDIAATVLDLAGLIQPPSFRGTTLLAPAPGDNQAIFEHPGRHFAGIRRGPLKWIDATRFKAEERFTRSSLRELHAAPAISLFDLEQDPLEKTNLAETRRPDSAQLQSTLEQWSRQSDDAEQATRSRPQAAPIDPALRESLRALGYVE